MRFTVTAVIGISLALAGTAGRAQTPADELLDAFKQLQAAEKTGDTKAQMRLYEKMIPLVPSVFGRDSQTEGEMLNNVGMLYIGASEYAKAEKALVRALALREARVGRDSVDAADSAMNLGLVYYCQGKYDTAEPMFRRALKTYEESAAGPVKIADAVNNLALMYHDQARYADAEAFHRRALALREEALGGDDPKVADSLANLAIVLREIGKPDKAEQSLRRCLAIREKADPNSPTLADVLNNLALVCEDLAQYDKAEPLMTRSLAIREQVLGPTHASVGESLNNLANLYRSTDRQAKAEPLLKRALAIKEQRFGKDHASVAMTLCNLADLYADLGRNDEAEPIYLRSLAIREAVLGKNHPDTAITVNNLAILYKDTNRFEKAGPLYARSLQIRETNFGKSHAELVWSLNSLAKFHVAAGNLDEAAAAFDRTRRIQRDYVARILPVLSEKDQQNFLTRNHSSRFQTAVGFAVSAKDRPGVAETSAAWVLNGKAVALQALVERTLLTRDSRDPAITETAVGLIKVRTELSTLSFAAPRPGEESAYQAKLAALTQSERALAEQLARLAGTPLTDPWVELAAVRAALPAKSVLVELCFYWKTNFAAKSHENAWVDARVAAWVIPPRGAVTLVDLGPSTPIYAALNDVRTQLFQAPKVITDVGEKRAEEQLRPALRKLSALVRDPIAAAAGDATEWIVSPDQALWLVPWEILTLSDGKYLVETTKLRYVVSGRDLVPRKATAKTAATAPVIFADPDFDLPSAEVAAQTRKALSGKGGAPIPALAGQRLRGKLAALNISYAFQNDGVVVFHDEDAGGAVAGQGKWEVSDGELIIQTPMSRFVGSVDGQRVAGVRTRKGDGGDTIEEKWHFELPAGTGGAAEPTLVRSAAKFTNVQRLPGTSVEAEAVKPKLAQYARREPRLLTDKQALEGVFKAVKHPQVAVLSTHGFFLPGNAPAPAAADGREGTRSAQPASASRENPLLRCGLLLAGCNDGQNARDGQDDGVLTGLEIVGTDLRGTELVVLSACETGLGDVTSGEGVAGLRQAFQLAGAESVVASLWKVPDRDTALLMACFFETIPSAASKASALREAQLALIAERRKRSAAVHPYFWAAFTLTGRE